ncbi:MAG TPA: YggT family protein [Patescibacteria group bacterium]|jgi:YggT family protein|nr:YggT family protein [Patescibacteria group bacterium]
MCAGCLLAVYLEAFINVLFLGLTLAIFGRVILSWVPTRLPWGLNDFIFSVTEPILAPIRRALPMAAGMDFSPLIALVLLQLVEQLLLRILPPAL